MICTRQKETGIKAKSFDRVTRVRSVSSSLPLLAEREREREGMGNERFASKDFHPTLHSSCASIPLCAKFCVSGVLHFKKTLFSSWPNTGAKSDAMPPKAEAANGRIVSADDDDDDDDDARPIADTPRFPNRARSALVDDDAIGSGRTLCTHTRLTTTDDMCFALFFPSSSCGFEALFILY